MVDFLTPYAVDDSVIPAAGLRRQFQDSTKGLSGVIRAADLKVTQLDVPGAGVKVAAGNDAIVCRAPGRGRESYGISLPEASTYLGDAGTGIPGTGSSGGRRDMIIHEVTDPKLPRTYTPREQIPEGMYSKITVVQGVPAGARSVRDVPALNEVTAVALAAINWPANTATITNAVVEDLRQIVNPNSQRGPLMAFFPEGALTGGRKIPTSGYGDWPLTGTERPLVRVPEWATHLSVTAWVEGAWFVKGSSTTVDFLAGTRMGLGATFSENGIITNGPLDNADRRGFVIIGRVTIPPAMRGTEQRILLQGARSTNDTTGALYVDYQSCVSMDWEFTEAV